jgi:protein-disulfide isomerase
MPMITVLARLSLAALAIAFTAASPARAELTAAQRAEFEGVIKEYLLKHPELIDEVTAKQAANRAAAETERRKGAFVTHASAIYSSPRQVTLGNPDGEVTLVEFFDYNCGFCKKALPNMLELIKAYPQLKVVLKEFPVLGANSVEAAKVAVAVRMQDNTGVKYLDFHQRLMTGGPADKARALTAAREAGLDMARLETDLASDEVALTIDESRKLAAALNIRGTPSYVIADEVVVGAVGLPILQEKLQRTRK